MRHLLLLTAALSLAACSHPVTVIGRDGTAGVGTATRGFGSGSMNLAMSGEAYAGKWTGVTSGINTIGTALLVSDKGSRLRCSFEYGGMTDAGFGSCKDGQDRSYDLQIE